MKKFTISLVVACTFCVAAAVAQMAPGSSGQGTQPSMGSPRGQQQPGMGQPDQNDPAGQTSQPGNNTNHMDNGEKKLKGCLQSQGSQYVLETKKGKEVALSGQDLSANVGHEVVVKGTWQSSNSGMSQSSTGNASEKAFNVSEVKSISDTCSGKGKHENSNMGTGANGTNPNGSGTYPANTGGGTQSPSGTGTQPPQ